MELIQIQLRLITNRNDKNIISFIGVALLARWNGYDRLIKAIEKYNGEGNQVRAQFHIVGKGISITN